MSQKWDINECDCEEVGGSCRLGHDEILRLRAQLKEARDRLHKHERAHFGALKRQRDDAMEEAARAVEPEAEYAYHYEAREALVKAAAAVRALKAKPEGT